LNLELYDRFNDQPDGQPDELDFYYSSAKEYSSSGINFRLTFDKTKRLLRFSMPKFFGVHCYNYDFNNVPFNQIADLIGITNGKIGLFFYSVPNEVRGLPLVQSFAHRLNEVNCDAVVYEQMRLTNQVFDCGRATNLRDIGQLKQILRHGMKKLVLSTDSRHYLYNPALNDERNDVVCNAHLEEVNLQIRGCNHVEDVKIIATLLENCPNLKKFTMRLRFSARRHVEFDYIVDQTLMYRDLMNELRNSYLG